MQIEGFDNNVAKVAMGPTHTAVVTSIIMRISSNNISFKLMENYIPLDFATMVFLVTVKETLVATSQLLLNTLPKTTLR